MISTFTAFTHFMISTAFMLCLTLLPKQELYAQQQPTTQQKTGQSSPQNQAYLQTTSQQLLTLDEAIRIALEKNYSIRIARNAGTIADNNANGLKGIGAAGMLPNVNASGSWSESRDNVRQFFFNGTSQERTGARTDRANASVQLTWTLFDGLQMFALRDRFATLQQQTDMALRQSVENTIAQVMTGYFTVVEQSVLLTAQRTALGLSRERLTIAVAKANLGSSSELDAQNARVDYNADSAAYLRQEAILLNAKTAFLQVLGDMTLYPTLPFKQMILSLLCKTSHSQRHKNNFLHVIPRSVPLRWTIHSHKSRYAKPSLFTTLH